MTTDEERTICCMICGEPLGFLIRDGPKPKALCSNCKAFAYITQEAEKE